MLGRKAACARRVTRLPRPAIPPARARPSCGAPRWRWGRIVLAGW